MVGVKVRTYLRIDARRTLALGTSLEVAAVHSVPNKITGGLLFIFPLTLACIDLRYSAAVVCMVATIAAVYEGYLIRAGRAA